MLRPPPLTDEMMNIASDEEDEEIPDESFSGVQQKSQLTDIAMCELRYIKDLGHGSQGKVELHQYISTGELFAVKVVPVDLDPESRKLLIREVKNIFTCSSPHVVGIHGVFFQDGCARIVLEYLENGTLRALLRKKKKISENILAEWIRQVLSGLSYLHGIGLLHRDIKPSNLLFDKCGNIKISDFGVSAQVSIEESTRDTWIGSLTYMSPERIRGEKYKFDSDIWALGITIFEAATGSLPVPSSNSGNALWEILQFLEEDELPKLPEECSVEMQQFVSACLQKQPSQRATLTQLINHPWLKKTPKPSKMEILDFIKK